MNSLSSLNASYRRHLKAGNKSPKTILAYCGAVDDLGKYLDREWDSPDPEDIVKGHIESFMAYLLARYKPATAHNRFRGLNTFFHWALEEGEIAKHPMERMKAPILPENPPEVIPEEVIRRLLDSCSGNSFDDRRDTAIIRLLIDTGLRRAELVNLTEDDVDLELQVCWVLGKGRRKRQVPFGNRTTKAIDRYLRKRKLHKDSRSDRLWLGPKGPIAITGVNQMLKRRSRNAHLNLNLYPHLFRHTAAHSLLLSGYNEGDLCVTMGWRTRQMASRYGASAAAERARENYHRIHAPGDRI